MGESPLRYDPFRQRLDAFARGLPHMEQGSVGALHHTRVASRRLRELLPLLKLHRKTTQKFNRRLRKVTRHLGTVRELDVLVLLIQELQRNGRYPTDALTQLGASVAHARTAAHKRLAAKLPTAKLKRLADALERVAERVESDDTRSSHPRASRPARAWVWALEARLAGRAVRARAAIEAAGVFYVPAHLHAVRIALKKLRYAAELSREVRGERITADVAALKTAQDVLGQLHDLEVLLEWGHEVPDSSLPPDVTAWRELGTLVHAVEDDCRQLHARYMRDRTKLCAIADRLGASRRAALPVDHRAAS